MEKIECKLKFGNYEFAIGKRPYVMGILNITPDSFSDGSKYFSSEAAIERAFEIEREGADFLDIGAQSTKPGCTQISENEELSRLIPVLEALNGKLKIPISVDTFYPSVAKSALKYGASLINDVREFDSKMFQAVADSECGIIVTHCEGNAVNHVDYFNRKLVEAEKFGIGKERVCFDVGIGFGKTREEDLQILRNPAYFKVADRPLMVGCSRKRIIGKMIGNPHADERDFGTISANLLGATRGGDIFRVHNVKATVDSFSVLRWFVL